MGYFRDAADLLLEAEHRLLLADRPDASNAQAVYDELLEDYPSKALPWVLKCDWSAPQQVPVDDIDFSESDRWRASHEPIQPYMDRISGGRMKPVVLVKRPDSDKLMIVDGHHRTLAYKGLGKHVYAYVGICETQDQVEQAERLHSMQKGGSSKGSFSVASLEPKSGASSLEPDATAPSLLPEGGESQQDQDENGTSGAPAGVTASDLANTAPSGDKPAASIGIVVNPDGAILAVRHTWGERAKFWCLPGGTIDTTPAEGGPVAETPEQALCRELFEETGVNVVDCEACGTVTSPTDGRTVHVFRVTRWTGVPNIDPNRKDCATEIAEIRWLSKDELLACSGPYAEHMKGYADRGLLDVRQTDATPPGAAPDPAPTAGGEWSMRLPGPVTRPGPGRPRNLNFQGLPVRITRPTGTVQRGTDPAGRPWVRTYKTDYGHIPGTDDGTGKPLGVFVGPDTSSSHAFWVTQRDSGGAFDQYKVFVGYRSAGDASGEYMRHTPAKYFSRISEGSVGQLCSALGRKPSERLALSHWMAEQDGLTRQLDLGPADVHVPSAGGNYRPLPKRQQMAEITTKKRNALPGEAFALPKQRKYPIHDAAHTRNAAARLAQAKKAGKVTDADYKTASAAIKRAEKKFGIKSRNASAYELTVSGGVVTLRQLSQLSDVVGGKVIAFPGGLVSLRGQVDQTLTFSDGPVWIQVAKQGKFEGHSAGPFEMNGQTFQQIIANFKATANRQIPIDFEHASEQDPTQGNIPSEGAPAQGWIQDLKIGADGNLYGLVEWGDLAKEYIKAKKYKFFSPAIRFNSRDRVTGKPVGARMTSGALTNQPFLDGMAPMVARDFGDSGYGRTERMLVACSDRPGASVPVYDDVPVFERTMAESPNTNAVGSEGGYVHAPSEYMPQMRQILSMHPQSTATECMSALERLYDHLASCSFDHTKQPQGVDLKTPCTGLRDLLGARIGDTWDMTFDKARGLIAACMADAGTDMDDDDGGDEEEMAGYSDEQPHQEPDGDETVTIVAPASIVKPLLEGIQAAGTAPGVQADDGDTLGPRGNLADADGVGKPAAFDAGGDPNAQPGSAAPAAGTFDDGDTLGPKGNMADEDKSKDDAAKRTMPEKVTRAGGDVDGPDGGVEGPSGGAGTTMSAAAGSARHNHNPKAVGTNHPPLPTTNTENTMDIATQLKDAEGKNAVLASDIAKANTEIATLKDAASKAEANSAALTLKVTSLEGDLKAATDEAKTLKDEIAKRDEADLQKLVAEAFDTYKDKKHLTDASKKSMLIVARADREQFLAEYPQVAAGQRHLLQDLTTGKPAGEPSTVAASAAAEGGNAPARVSVSRLARQIARQKNVSLDVAQQMADRQQAQANKR